MNSVKQEQRGALETMISRKDLTSSFSIRRGRRYYLGKKEIFLLGISEGLGLCSSPKYHGVNIAVFFGNRPLPNHFLKIGVCHMAALFRGPTQEEWNDNSSSRMVVEKLALVSVSLKEIRFTPSGQKELYLPL